MFVDVDVQALSPCPGMAHLAGGHAHSRSGGHAPASPGGADFVNSWQQRLATTAHQRHVWNSSPWWGVHGPRRGFPSC